MRFWLNKFIVVLFFTVLPNALAHSDSVRMMVSFPNLVQQGFKLSAVGTSSGLKITGAKLSILIKQPNLRKEMSFQETQPGIYEITQPLAAGQYSFTFLDKTFANESLEYSISATLPRPVNQSTLMFVWPPTAGKPVQSRNLWLVFVTAPLALFVVLGFAWFNLRNKKFSSAQYRSEAFDFPKT